MHVHLLVRCISNCDFFFSRRDCHQKKIIFLQKTSSLRVFSLSLKQMTMSLNMNTALFFSCKERNGKQMLAFHSKQHVLSTCHVPYASVVRGGKVAKMERVGLALNKCGKEYSSSQCSPGSLSNILLSRLHP